MRVPGLQGRQTGSEANVPREAGQTETRGGEGWEKPMKPRTRTRSRGFQTQGPPDAPTINAGNTPPSGPDLHPHLPRTSGLDVQG